MEGPGNVRDHDIVPKVQQAVFQAYLRLDLDPLDAAAVLVHSDKNDELSSLTRPFYH
jgi:hypothetical protein